MVVVLSIMTMTEPQVKYTEKSVIIHRDENGFGLRVGGQNPVFVDWAHENGAAWKAGVRKDDRIIKVNGTLVRSFNHQEVVHMIQNCTPFVNLTLHSPEPIITEPSMTTTSAAATTITTNSVAPTSSSLIEGGNSSFSSAAGLQLSNGHQRLYHSATNISDWLLDIGDDLFQDNQHHNHHQHQHHHHPHPHNHQHHNQQPQPHLKKGFQQQNQTTSGYKLQINQQDNNAASHTSTITSPSQQPTGLSKLVNSSGTSPVTQHNQSSSNIRDNPYYYYKNSSDKNESAANNQEGNTSKASTAATTTSSGLSIVRSRSSSKMSIRSTTGKYKPRNLRSRIVGDLRSLTITNTQATPSSLSTSPSSSDLSDCDDTDTSRLNCSNSSNHTTRRLEIIRELIDTEKTHTERLKHLNDLLYKPIKTEGLVPPDQLKMVFSCHKTLYKIHRQIYKLLHTAQTKLSENHNEPLIGKALIEIFDSELGRHLERAACTFCACQSTNTELLNRLTRKDTKSGEFLAQVANQQMIGRLGIKDLLASCFQRLTKYPLLLENLLKATPTGANGIHSKSLSEGESTTTTASATPTPLDDDYVYERLCISKALHMTRQILTRVNEAVKRAISHNQLREIWKKTDKYPSLPAIDIETQQLLHEGPLTLRLARRTFDVYVLLLTHYLVILTREGQDKYKLKYFTADSTQFSPIFNIDEHLATRDTATDENGFYLLCKRKDDSRIYEFASQSPAERAKWKEKIHTAQLYNFATVPDDDNTLTRYTELITLATSSNTPNNIEQIEFCSE